MNGASPRRPPGLLGAGLADVDAPVVRAHLDPADGGDRVGDEESVVPQLNESGDEVVYRHHRDVAGPYGVDEGRLLPAEPVALSGSVRAFSVPQTVRRSVQVWSMIRRNSGSRCPSSGWAVVASAYGLEGPGLESWRSTTTGVVTGAGYRSWRPGRTGPTPWGGGDGSGTLRRSGHA